MVPQEFYGMQQVLNGKKYSKYGFGKMTLPLNILSTEMYAWTLRCRQNISMRSKSSGISF